MQTKENSSKKYVCFKSRFSSFLNFNEVNKYVNKQNNTTYKLGKQLDNNN